MAQKLELTVITYGPGAKRAEIELRPRIPRHVQGNPTAIQRWSQGFLIQISRDLKHTNVWNCAARCGKPARDGLHNTLWWMCHDPPRVLDWIFLICDARDGPCIRIVDDMAKPLKLQATGPDASIEVEPNLTGAVCPLASSCLGCKEDDTSKPTVSMSRCSGCKLSRYCGPECQSLDWPIHKKFCKIVESVKFVGF